MKPEVIVDCACETGENPLWHPDEKRVYWVDIPPGRIYRYDPSTRKTETFEAGVSVGGFTFQPDGALLLFLAKGAVATWRDGAFLKTIIKEIPDERETRFNDVIADPEGRVFCGTMPAKERPGRLYRLDRDGTIVKLLDGIGVSNGLGFTPDLKRMYYTDSRKREIYLFDYDRATGDISNRRVFVTVPEGEGVPDGLTVDAEGCVWGARWDGSRLVRYSPQGKEMLRVDFPGVKKVSSLIFCGEDYTDIYVTTAGGNKRTEEGANAGALFHLSPGVKGAPEFRSRIAVV